MREIFRRFLELESIEDGTPEYAAAGHEMDEIWDSLTSAEKAYHESGHEGPMPNDNGE